MSRSRVNNTDVAVVWGPAAPTREGEGKRAVLQVILWVGKHPTTEEHLAVQQLLQAVKRLQDARIPDGRSS